MLNRLPSLLRACGRPRRAAVLLALLALGVLGVYRLGWYWRAQTHLGAAQRALARRDFPEARANLMVCLQVWPDRPELHLLAAQAARRAGALDEAADHINSCRALRGEPTAVQLEEALLRAQPGDLAGVEQYLPRAEQQ